MALRITNCLNYSAGSTAIRSLRYIICKPKCSQFATSQILNKKFGTDTPVKYTTNKAAKVSIQDIIGLKTKGSFSPWYEKYVVLASIAGFLLYFCVLREENDIDEILKGNKDFDSPKVQLLKLKIQLKYCEKNNLPTAALRAKIEALEGDKRPFFPGRI